MKNILCIDSAFDSLTVALSCKGQVFCQQNLIPKQHGVSLIGYIKALFVEADFPSNQLDAIAYNAGPASFTGVRMGAGVAMSMGHALEKPVIALSSLLLLAKEAKVTGGIVLATNAYQGEIYTARFEKQAELVRKTEDSLCDPEALNKLVQEEDTLFTDCEQLYGAMWQPVLVEKKAKVLSLPLVSGDTLLKVAEAAFLNGEGKPAMQASPQYLRKAESWKRP